MSKHSPLPWSITLGAQDLYPNISCPIGSPLVEGVGRPDAELIVRAVNSHEALVEALRVLIERVEHYAPQMDRSGDLEEARLVLAKARGES